MERVSPTKFSYPQRSLLALPIQQKYPQQVIISNSAKYLSPHRVLLPSKIVRILFSPQSNPLAKFIPQRSYLLLPVFLQLSSPAEAKIYSPTSAQEWLPGTRQGFTFLDDKHTFINIAFSYIISCIYASYLTISFMLRTSLLDPYHALHMTDLYLSGKIQ